MKKFSEHKILENFNVEDVEFNIFSTFESANLKISLIPKEGFDIRDKADAIILSLNDFLTEQEITASINFHFPSIHIILSDNSIKTFFENYISDYFNL